MRSKYTCTNLTYKQINTSVYLNLDQDGNYTKHYYADDQRIASKIRLMKRNVNYFFNKYVLYSK